MYKNSPTKHNFRGLSLMGGEKEGGREGEGKRGGLDWTGLNWGKTSS
jgi:hypothetical protein